MDEAGARRRSAQRAALVGALGLALAGACAGPTPIIEDRYAMPSSVGARDPADATRSSYSEGSWAAQLSRGVYVESLPPPAPELAAEAREVAALVEAELRERGVPIEPSSVAELRLEVRLRHWRERSGGALGSIRPARAAFDLRLVDVERGRMLRKLGLDETQQAFSTAPRAASSYPGGGLRWLSIEELGGWVIEVAVDALLEAPGR